jgi:hypothetical protein
LPALELEPPELEPPEPEPPALEPPLVDVVPLEPHAARARIALIATTSAKAERILLRAPLMSLSS